MSCYNSTVPSSPPQNVIVTSVNPASLMVSWQPPAMIDHNGMITGHVINYTRVGSSDMMSVNVNSGTTHTISGLVAYVDYSVIVAARTVNGTGTFSSAVVQRSGVDGELNYKIIRGCTCPTCRLVACSIQLCLWHSYMWAGACCTQCAISKKVCDKKCPQQDLNVGRRD